MSNITKLLVLSIFLTGCSGMNNKNHHAPKDHHLHKDHHCHKNHHHIKGKCHNPENGVAHSVSAHSGHISQTAAATSQAVTNALKK